LTAERWVKRPRLQIDRHEVRTHRASTVER
jgi:hypothetical protein